MNRTAITALLSALIIAGCAELQPQPVSSQQQVAELKPDRSNLLLPLRHNTHYGLIRYGDGEVLFRDLTQPHPSMADQGIADAQSLEMTVPAVTPLPPEDNDTLYVGITSSGEQSVWDLEDASSVGIDENASEYLPADAPRRLEVVETLNIAEQREPEPVQGSDDSGCQGKDGYVRLPDEIWLARQQPEHWTIQVVSAVDSSEPCIEDEYLTEIKATGARRFSVYFQNALWNVAVVGRYDTSEEAMAAASQFDAPWVRKIGDFRTRRCNSVAFMPDELKTTLGRWCGSDETVTVQEPSAPEEFEDEEEQVVAIKPVTSGSPFHQ